MGRCLITHDDISVLRHIEAKAYPEHMRQMQDIESASDLADYCECKVSQLRVLHTQDWYVICAEKSRTVEIVDFASLNGCRDIMKVISFLYQFKGKLILMDARESTSYKIVKAASRHSKLEIIKDETWSWGDEVMHEISCKLL